MFLLFSLLIETLVKSILGYNPLFEERFDNLNKDSLVYFANALCNLIAFKDKKNKKSAAFGIRSADDRLSSLLIKL
jgi:hypothetical protein